MPAVMTSTPQALGEIRFNDVDGMGQTVPLANCPPTPTSLTTDAVEVRINELEEVARSLGVKL